MRTGWFAPVVAVLLISSGVLAQDKGAVDAAKPDDRQKLRDELVEARVREEILTMEVDAERQHLRQAVQSLKQVEFRFLPQMGVMGMGGGPGAAPPADDQRKQQEIDLRRRQEEAVMASRIRLEELKEKFVETNKELSRASQRRAELEERLGERPPVKPDVEKRLAEVERKLDSVLKGSKR
jgi:hypothetical protein